MKQERLGPGIAALGGALWCCSYMWPMLDPFRLDVVLRNDWAQHTFGWLFLRRESLSFPLGTIRDFLYPFGTTLGYMDSIPWLALALRPFSGLLPSEFQYLGLWIMGCSALVAWAAARISALSTRHWEQQAVAGVFVAMAPTLQDRIIHPALCGHFLLVLAIALHLAPSNSPTAARRTLWGAFALLVVSTATHPYLAMMVLALVISLPFRLVRQLGIRVVSASLGMLILVASELTLFGYRGGEVRLSSVGFGGFSANLNTFVNSMGHSRIFAGLPNASMQYEGYCYLGAGCFFLCGVVICSLFRQRSRARILSFPWRRAILPLCASGALAIFALATPWQWGERRVLNVPLYRQVEWLAMIFRSSGRFVWPLAYLINIALITAVLRALRPMRWLVSAVLLGTFALQAYDIDTTNVAGMFRAAPIEPHAARAWSLADRTFKHLVMYPAEIQEACESPGGYRDERVNALAYLAYRRGWTFNSGYAARLHRDTADYCAQLQQQIRAGELQADTIYVVARRDVALLRKSGATCGRLDATYACVLPKAHPFALYLAQHKR